MNTKTVIVTTKVALWRLVRAV